MGCGGVSSAPATRTSAVRPPPGLPCRACGAAQPPGAAVRQRDTLSGGWQRRRRCHSPPPPAAAASRSHDWPDSCADAELPAKGQQLLLDLVLPGASPQAVWASLFGSVAGGSPAEQARHHQQPSQQQQPAQQQQPLDTIGERGLLAHFLEAGLGCTHLECVPWEPAGDDAGSRSRVLTYRTPLTPHQRLLLPLGPQALGNRDEQRVTACTDGGLEVRCSCSTAGVPFADCFTNQLRWRLLPLQGSGGGMQPGGPAAAGLRHSGVGARVLLAARCSFHRSVPFPLKSQIERESLQVRAAGTGPAVFRNTPCGCPACACWCMMRPPAAEPLPCLQTVAEVYARFAPLLQQHVARSGSGSDQGGGGGGSPPTSNAAASSHMSVSGNTDATLDAKADAGAAAAAAPAPAAAGAAAAAAAQEDALPAVPQLGAFDDGGATWRAAKARVSPRLTARTAAGLLQQIERLWPSWAACGCRLPSDDAPLPDEAAVALRVVGFQAQRHEQQLARHRVVVGLVEALRLVPPRSARAASSGGGSSGSLGSSAGMAAALWGMSLLGRSMYWEEETEALCALLATRPFSSLKRVR